MDDIYVQKAIQQLNPKTIDEACEFRKGIAKVRETSSVFHLKKESDVNQCLDEIKMLHSKVEYLQQLVISLQKSMVSKFDRTAPYVANQSQNRTRHFSSNQVRNRAGQVDTYQTQRRFQFNRGFNSNRKDPQVR